MNIKEGRVELLEFDLLPKAGFHHFSTTIHGGISKGNYETFNLGMYSGDEIDCVAENRERLAQILNIKEEDIYVPYQTHEDKVLIIGHDFLQKSDLEKVKLLNGIDALVTDQRNICIGVTTADCVPILIFDDVKKVFAAVHAGWKGTVNKITERTIETMVQHFGCDDPQALLIGIGPCISQEKFEVGGEVSEAFRQAGFPMERIAYMNEYTGKMHIDLQEANKIILTDCGIPSTHIEQANLCTYSNPDKFFSARRQGFHSGRMLTGGILR